MNNQYDNDEVEQERECGLNANTFNECPYGILRSNKRECIYHEEDDCYML